jgi:hypothetical protein
MTPWMLALGAAGCFCVVRGIVGLRRFRYTGGALGLISGAVILLVPIPSHAVQVDLIGP